MIFNVDFQDVGRHLLLLLSAAFLLSSASSASASEIIDRNAHAVRLGVDTNGQALVSYKVGGRAMHVRAWGAVDARQPTTSRPQVRFRKDYSGRYWASFRNQCRAYDGQKLASKVAPAPRPTARTGRSNLGPEPCRPIT